jgi:hypothetical protein
LSRKTTFLDTKKSFWIYAVWSPKIVYKQSLSKKFVSFILMTYNFHVWIRIMRTLGYFWNQIDFSPSSHSHQSSTVYLCWPSMSRYNFSVSSVSLKLTSNFPNSVFHQKIFFEFNLDLSYHLPLYLILDFFVQDLGDFFSVFIICQPFLEFYSKKKRSFQCKYVQSFPQKLLIVLSMNPQRNFKCRIPSQKIFNCSKFHWRFVL